MRALIGPVAVLALALAVAASACKQSQPASAALRSDGVGAGPQLSCMINPASGDDDLQVPTADGLVTCSDAALSAEHDALEQKRVATAGQIDDKERAENTAEGKKAPTDADLPSIGGDKAKPAPGPTTLLAATAAAPQAGDNTTQPAPQATEPQAVGLRLGDTNEELIARLRRENDELRRTAQALLDRQAAIDREIAARTGQGVTGGACVLTRDTQITACRANSIQTDCKQVSEYNRAFYFRFGQCAEFQVGADFDDTFTNTRGACVKLRTDFRIDSCADGTLDTCFNAPEDLLTSAFRAGKACAGTYRVGDQFENMTADSQRPLVNTRFSSDCTYAGAALKQVRNTLGSANVFACPCGSAGDLVETAFYARGAEACKLLNARTSNVPAGTGGKFETDCKAATGVFRKTNDVFVCACGVNNELDQDTFYRNGFNACREGVNNTTGTGSRFKTNCELAGAAYKLATTTSGTTTGNFVCACGKNNDLTEAQFNQIGVQACRDRNTANPASNITQQIKDQFRQRCLDGKGLAKDDPFADDGMSCACGTAGIKLSLRTFARDVQLNTTQDFVSACLREVAISGQATPDQRSQIVRPAGSNPRAGSKCACSLDTTKTYCGVSINGTWVSNLGPYAIGSFVCGTGQSGDLCGFGSLATALTQDPRCR